MREKQDLVNERIKAKEVLVIDSDGEQLGVMPTKDALERAYAEDLDLCMLSENANPPVVKIMDYGKYRYEKQKKAKENKQKQRQKIVELKIIRVSPNIDSHDYDTKLKQARKFLEKGDKVQFLIRFRGRMVIHSELGLEVLNKIAEELSDISTIEQKPKLDGRKMILTLAPMKKK